MSRCLAILIAVSFARPVAAQGESWQFRWQKGLVLNYRVEHATQVSETVGSKKTETSSKLTIQKRWEVIDLDSKGHATLRLSLTSMRHEQVRPDKEILLFDSADVEKSTPELREMTKHLGQTIAELVIDAQGRVLEIKRGAGAHYDSDPPFVVVFPNVAPAKDQAWDRNYQIILEPPHGTGEKYSATQRTQCTKLADGKATLTLVSQVKDLPENQYDQIPLIQKQPNGEVVFDVRAGRLHSAKLTIEKTLEGHQGKGSSYRFLSTYTEQFIGEK